MSKEQPIFIHRPYPKVVYFNDEKTVWKIANSKEEEELMLSANIPAPKVENVPEKIINSAPNVDVSIETNQKRRPGRPARKG
jgi:hypothetical protein